MPDHRQTALEDMELLEKGDLFNKDALLLAGSVLMHCLLYIADVLFDIARTIESRS
jgi:hypothetical protein